VELLKAYSNENIILGRLQRLLELPQGREMSVRRPRKQLQRRLPPEQVKNLLAAYQAGQSTNEVAASYGVHRTTVVNILNRHGVPFRVRGMPNKDLSEVIRLYESGWSLAKLGRHFGVTGHNTISNALRKAGVTIRPRRGRPGEP
jgi:transposase